jgi:hypothetical protein
MVNFFRIVVAGILAVGLGGPALAQVAPAPLSQAQARLACGNGIVLGAVTLPDGSIEVTCEAQGAGQVPAALAGALTSEAAAVAAGVALFLVVISGSDDPATTTTTAPSRPID